AAIGTRRSDLRAAHARPETSRTDSQTGRRSFRHRARVGRAGPAPPTSEQVMRRKRISGKRHAPTQRLRARLHDAEATLEAIRSGAVDAVVVSGPRGDETRAFEGATHPYQVLLNAMSDGAALLSPDGTILFGNRRLGEIAEAALEDLRGSLFQQL